MESTAKLPHGTVLLRKIMWSSFSYYSLACHPHTSMAGKRAHLYRPLGSGAGLAFVRLSQLFAMLPQNNIHDAKSRRVRGDT